MKSINTRTGTWCGARPSPLSRSLTALCGVAFSYVVYLRARRQEDETARRAARRFVTVPRGVARVSSGGRLPAADSRYTLFLRLQDVAVGADVRICVMNPGAPTLHMHRPLGPPPVCALSLQTTGLMHGMHILLQHEPA